MTTYTVYAARWDEGDKVRTVVVGTFDALDDAKDAADADVVEYDSGSAVHVVDDETNTVVYENGGK